MYISLVAIKVTDSYEQHQAIWSLFPDTPERKRDHLFRVESKNKGQVVAILQSATEPKSSNHSEVLQSKPFKLDLSTGEYYKFKLVANPTKRLSKQRNIIEIKDEADQIVWLQRKLIGANVTVTSMESSLVESKKSYKSLFVTFEGVLQVIDADKINRAVVMGIGRKKHAGAGLLSLARTG